MQVPVVVVIPVDLSLESQGPDTLFRFVQCRYSRDRCVCLCFFLNATWCAVVARPQLTSAGYCFQASRTCARSCSCSVPAPARAPIGYRTDGGKIRNQNEYIFVQLTTRNYYTKSAMFTMSADRCVWGRRDSEAPPTGPPAIDAEEDTHTHTYTCDTPHTVGALYAQTK